VESKNRVCAAIAESIAPSIAGLLQNDHTIVDGIYQLNQGRGLYLLHVENDVSNIVRNLSAVDHLLQNTEPADTPPAQAQRIEAMKKSLRDVAYQQLMTLNLLDGTVESAQMAEFMDTSGLPDFAAPDESSGFSASQHDAVDRSGREEVPGRGHPWALAQAADFFPALRHTEDAAAAAVTSGAAGCKRIDHAVTLPK
jgi:hypothetical protein